MANQFGFHAEFVAGVVRRLEFRATVIAGDEYLLHGIVTSGRPNAGGERKRNGAGERYPLRIHDSPIDCQAEFCATPLGAFPSDPRRVPR